MFVTLWAVSDAACPPAAVCNGLVAGFVYATVTASPLTTGLARVSSTLVAEIATELTVLVTEFTFTVNAEAAGSTFASVRLYVISSLAGVAFSTDALRKTGDEGVTTPSIYSE